MKSIRARNEDDVRPALREAGLRCTMPRLRVASALRGQQGHLTVDSIYALVAESEPAAPMALSTVYRTLETLADARLVAETHEHSRTAYEWIDHSEPHYHLTCTRCGTEVSLDPSMLGRLEEQIRSATDFEVHLDHVAMTGLCAACRARTGERKPSRARD
jgi:Fur family ferric uptake transcriptional regulator